MNLPDFKRPRDSNRSSSMYFPIFGFYSRGVGDKKIIRPLLWQRWQRSWNWQAAQVLHGKLFSPFLFPTSSSASHHSDWKQNFCEFRTTSMLLLMSGKRLRNERTFRNTSPYFVSALLDIPLQYYQQRWTVCWRTDFAGRRTINGLTAQAQVRACRHRVAIAINASTF